MKGKLGSFRVFTETCKDFFFFVIVLTVLTSTVRAANAQVPIILFDCGGFPCISVQLWVPKSSCGTDVGKTHYVFSEQPVLKQKCAVACKCFSAKQLKMVNVSSSGVQHRNFL